MHARLQVLATFISRRARSRLLHFLRVRNGFVRNGFMLEPDAGVASARAFATCDDAWHRASYSYRATQFAAHFHARRSSTFRGIVVALVGVVSNSISATTTTTLTLSSLPPELLISFVCYVEFNLYFSLYINSHAARVIGREKSTPSVAEWAAEPDLCTRARPALLRPVCRR